MKKRIIWSNILTEEDEKGIIDGWIETQQELSDDNMECEELSDEQKFNIINDYMDMWLFDERVNLDIQLTNPILVIGNIGTWKGNRQGYKIINSGNIKDILYSDCDYAEWYSDGYNIRFTGHHHDGANYYEYREIKNMDNIDNFLDKLYEGEEITRNMINYYTRSILTEIKKVYGW